VVLFTSKNSRFSPGCGVAHVLVVVFHTTVPGSFNSVWDLRLTMELRQVFFKFLLSLSVSLHQFFKFILI